MCTAKQPVVICVNRKKCSLSGYIQVHSLDGRHRIVPKGIISRKEALHSTASNLYYAMLMAGVTATENVLTEIFCWWRSVYT